MAKKVAPPKLTGGGGFVFEDKVAAYFLSCLLSSQPPLDPNLGILTRIDFQTRVDGWLLDDLLLTVESPGVRRRCAFSIKSNQQFTQKSAPQEFVIAAWEQVLHEESDQFDEWSDKIGIITAPLSQQLSAQLQQLFSKARAQDPASLMDRLRTKGSASHIQEDLLKSFACPSELASRHPEEKVRTGNFLKHIIVLEFDFENDPSNRHREAVHNCRNSLKSGLLEEANDLWNDLVGIARDYRPLSGYLNLNRVLALLRRKYQFKDYPEYSSDWIRLTELTTVNLSVIPDTIGGSVSLPRQEERDELKERLTISRAVILRGPSGCGKTVLAKLWAAEAAVSSKVLWWDARSLDVHDFQTFERTLALSHPLSEALRIAATPDAFVIVDGLDRVFSEQAFRNLSVLAQALDMNSELSPWRLIVTCQPEEWERIQLQFARANISTSDWSLIDIGLPADFDPVWKAFPALQRMALQPQLKSLLLKPKVLDLLATKLSAGGNVDTTKWVGESDLIEWFWGTEVQNHISGTTRARFLKLLGEKQADVMQQEIPDVEFSSADLASTDSLIHDRICKKQEERLSFQHDLYGDWARQRILFAKTNELREYLEQRLSSPLWHRALRLYALHLLEQNADLTRWRAALSALSSDQHSGNLGQDLILDSVIFAADPLPILERMWPDLAADKGVLLRRLLERFLQVATLPNPAMLLISRMFGDDSDVEAATTLRLPYWPYWLPMLRFLRSHLDDVIKVAPLLISETADKWLRLGGENWPLRREAADLALAVANDLLRFQRRGWIVSHTDKFPRVTFRAALAGAGDLPDGVAKFALEASCRLDPPAEGPGGETQMTEPRVVPSPFGRSIVRKSPPPWPDGPKRRIYEPFQKVCLDADSLGPLIKFNPSVAREVLLANLIEEPRSYDSGIRFRDIDGIEQNYDWYPPLYFRGPLLNFLKIYPDEGLEVIIRLVNFATERWASRWRRAHRPPEVAISIFDGERKWLGEGDVYFWYRNNSRCPDAVVVALMAMEKWLYDELDAKRPINQVVETILRRSNSVAFAGLLNSVGRKEPSLFQGPLQPLLPVPEFYIWEELFIAQGHDYVMSCVMIGWETQGKMMSKLAYDWHNLSHRKISFRDMVVYFYLNLPGMRPFFDKARLAWVKRLESETGEFKSELEWLIPRFDIKNYRIEDNPATGRVWMFEPPRELCEKDQKIFEENAKRLSLQSFPLQCRQWLDTTQPLPEDSLEQFWGELQRISALTIADPDDFTAIKTENAVCAGIAVLLILQRDWLKRHPEREQWCRQKLIETIQSPPPPGELDFEGGKSTWEWDRFCAQAIPVLWVEEPDSHLLRECVGLLASSRHYQTVQFLFSSASKYRDILGSHFKQLQHFLLRWAVARQKSRRGLYDDENQFDSSAWLRQEIGSFINGSISQDIPIWEKLIGENNLREQSRLNHRRERLRQSPGIDLELIQSAYSWLPMLDQASSNDERAEWIGIWKEMFDCTMRMLGEEVEGEEGIDGTPYEWDRWIFSRIAPLIWQLRPSEQPENFWRPILSLGVSGRHWVEDFLWSYFIHGLQHSQVPERFVDQWRAMIEFAFSSPGWHSPLKWRSYYLQGIWCRLMGFDRNLWDFWGASHRSLVTAMRDLYERWSSAHLKMPSCTVAFTVFLRQLAAVDILFDGVTWLETVVVQADDEFWNERDIPEGLAALLDYCWSFQAANLRRQQSAFNAFMSILRKLADRQNAIALEIQQRVTATIGQS